MDVSDENREIRDLHKVLEITRSMVAAEDLGELLTLIIDRAMELLDAERATVFLYDAENDELVSRVATGTGEIRIPAGSGIAGAAAMSGKVVNVPDAYADKRFNPDVDRRTKFVTRNILSVPMSGYDGALVGVMQVLNRHHAGQELDGYEITLAESLAAQAGVAIQRANLIEHYLRKQEMERDMRIAQDIQQGMLPTVTPSIEGFEVAGFSQPADETGGDTYDYMPLADGRCMFMVADATGHGVGPALVIAQARAMVRAMCLQNADLPTIMRTANDLLIADLDSGRFVTCFLGLLNPIDAKLTFVSAGHGPMLFYDRSEDKFTEVAATGLPLAVLPCAEYADTLEHPFDSGDFAVIMTDGFFEAANHAGEVYGMERICDLLRIGRDTPPDVMIEMLNTGVCDFTCGRPQADDLTAVVIRKR